MRSLAELQACSPENLFSTAEAALYLSKRPGLLREWRMAGRGPRFIKQIHYVDYRKRDLDAWLMDCIR